MTLRLLIYGLIKCMLNLPQNDMLRRSGLPNKAQRLSSSCQLLCCFERLEIGHSFLCAASPYCKGGHTDSNDGLSPYFFWVLSFAGWQSVFVGLFQGWVKSIQIEIPIDPQYTGQFKTNKRSSLADHFDSYPIVSRLGPYEFVRRYASHWIHQKRVRLVTTWGVDAILHSSYMG